MSFSSSVTFNTNGKITKQRVFSLKKITIIAQKCKKKKKLRFSRIVKKNLDLVVYIHGGNSKRKIELFRFIT